MSGKKIIIYSAVLSVVVVLAAVVSRTSGPSQDELFLYCGAGLRPVIDEVVPLFTAETGVQVRVDYNASNLLLGRIKISRTGDLFMPGDVYYIDQARQEGLIEFSREVVVFVPVILVREGNPENIQGLTDLTGDGIRLGLADPRTAAIGRTSRRLLQANNISPDEYEENLVFDSVTVHDLVTGITLGSIDAAIVWEPIARRAEGAEVIAIPAENNVVAPVPIAVLTVSEQSETALKFVDFILSDPVREVFRRHDYGDPADYQ